MEETPDRSLPIQSSVLEQQGAHATAALLTATAFGVGDFCFVAPSDAGLGLFARVPLRRGQAIVEYYGPRLPLSELRHSTYALEVPDGSGTFIDGNRENVTGSVADGARSPAIYANHSRLPNCQLQHWPRRTAASAPPHDTLWLVAKESVGAGCELRFDYEEGGSNYWQGFPPRESNWGSRRVTPPPPSGCEPTIDYLGAALAGERPPWPEGGGQPP